MTLNVIFHLCLISSIVPHIFYSAAFISETKMLYIGILFVVCYVIDFYEEVGRNEELQRGRRHFFLSEYGVQIFHQGGCFKLKRENELILDYIYIFFWLRRKNCEKICAAAWVFRYN